MKRKAPAALLLTGLTSLLMTVGTQALTLITNKASGDTGNLAEPLSAAAPWPVAGLLAAVGGASLLISWRVLKFRQEPC